MAGLAQAGRIDARDPRHRRRRLPGEELVVSGRHRAHLRAHGDRRPLLHVLHGLGVDPAGRGPRVGHGLHERDVGLHHRQGVRIDIAVHAAADEVAGDAHHRPDLRSRAVEAHGAVGIADRRTEAQLAGDLIDGEVPVRGLGVGEGRHPSPWLPALRAAHLDGEVMLAGDERVLREIEPVPRGARARADDLVLHRLAVRRAHDAADGLRLDAEDLGGPDVRRLIADRRDDLDPDPRGGHTTEG